MSFEGVTGMYPQSMNYGTQGYFIDFEGANQAEFHKRIEHLKKINWIDQFTMAVAVKWTILNQWDDQFYSVTMVCESPGLNIRHCSYDVENVKFLERSFEATVTDDGKIVVESRISKNLTFPVLILFIMLMLANLVYTGKIALEMNLGFSVLINALEFMHLFILEVSLFAYCYSMLMKRSFEVDLLDRGTFVDLGMFYFLDKYSMIALNMCLIFYPFRLFTFISRFNFAKSVNGMLNTIFRITPGIFTYMTIILVISSCISFSCMLLLRQYIPQMRTIMGAIFNTLSINFFELSDFRQMA